MSIIEELDEHLAISKINLGIDVTSGEIDKQSSICFRFNIANQDLT